MTELCWTRPPRRALRETELHQEMEWQLLHFSHPHNWSELSHALLLVHFCWCTPSNKLLKNRSTHNCALLLKAKFRLRDKENRISYSSLHDCCCTRWECFWFTDLPVHYFIIFFFFNWVLLNEQITTLQERKATPIPNRWERALDKKSPCSFPLLVS